MGISLHWISRVFLPFPPFPPLSLYEMCFHLILWTIFISTVFRRKYWPKEIINIRVGIHWVLTLISMTTSPEDESLFLRSESKLQIKRYFLRNFCQIKWMLFLLLSSHVFFLLATEKNGENVWSFIYFLSFFYRNVRFVFKTRYQIKVNRNPKNIFLDLNLHPNPLGSQIFQIFSSFYSKTFLDHIRTEYLRKLNVYPG